MTSTPATDAMGHLQRRIHDARSFLRFEPLISNLLYEAGRPHGFPVYSDRPLQFSLGRDAPRDDVAAGSHFHGLNGHQRDGSGSQDEVFQQELPGQ